MGLASVFRIISGHVGPADAGPSFPHEARPPRIGSMLSPGASSVTAQRVPLAVKITSPNSGQFRTPRPRSRATLCRDRPEARSRVYSATPVGHRSSGQRVPRLLGDEPLNRNHYLLVRLRRLFAKRSALPLVTVISDRVRQDSGSGASLPLITTVSEQTGQACSEPSSR